MAAITWEDVISGMKDELDRATFPRAVLAVERDFGDIFIRAIDIDSTPQWNESTIFACGSMAKAFIALGLLRLFHLRSKTFDKDLDAILDKKVWTFLDMKELGQEGVRGDPNPGWQLKQKITLRQMLTHTASLRWIEEFEEGLVVPPEAEPGLESSGYVGSPGLTNESIFVPAHDNSPATWIPARKAVLRDVSRHVMRQRLLDKENGGSISPGTHYQYSNYDYILAARILEAYTGRPFEEFLQQELLQPLGMEDTFFTAPSKVPTEVEDSPKLTSDMLGRIANVKFITKGANDIAKPLGCNSKACDRTWNKFRRGWSYTWPEGGVYSTAGDLLKLLHMLRNKGVSENGPRLLPASFVKAVFTNQLAMNPLLKDGEGQALGFGYTVKEVTDPTDPAQKGWPGLKEGSISNLGRFFTASWVDKRRGLSGVFLSQRITDVVGDNLESLKQAEKALKKFTELASKMAPNARPDLPPE